MNHLSDESSPYLLQHARNPVDWHPWGEEAFGLALELDRPIFLSIGYSTCHWCHVMAEESFEDHRVAEIMNASFVCVKVDREERPDVDSLYMKAALAMSGSGGWPLNVILTPDGHPFYAFTYLPRRGGPRRPGMLELLPSIAMAWSDRRNEIEKSASGLTSALDAGPRTQPGESRLDGDMAGKACEQLAATYDHRHGGFGPGPKFPMAHGLLFLIRRHARTGEDQPLEMALRTLRAIRRGGVFDQVGLGVHRYSTDARWHLPHFEKMLYDQALVALAAVEAWKVSGDSASRGLAEGALDYALRDLRHPRGGFCSAEDADSPGGEGAFYTWTAEELRSLLAPKDYRLAETAWGVREGGNYRDEATGRPSGRNVLDMTDAPEPDTEDRRRLETMRARLLQARGRRFRPSKDDKILTDWNGLMIAALARAGLVLDRRDYVEAARKAAEFIDSELRDSQGRLLHRWRKGDAGIGAFADDFAYLAWGMLELHQVTQDHCRLRTAIELMDGLEKAFRQDANGLYAIAAEAEGLPARPQELRDGALPSANSVALQNLHRLWRLTGRSRFGDRLDRMMPEYAAAAGRAPSTHSMGMAALEEMLAEPVDAVVCGDPSDAATFGLLNAVRRASTGSTLVLLRRPGDELLDRLAPHTSGMAAVDGKPATYICRGFACGLPLTDPEEIEEALSRRNPA